MLDCLIILKDAVLGLKDSNWYFVFHRKCFVIIFSRIQNTVVRPSDLPFILMSIGEMSMYWDTPRSANLNSQIHLYLVRKTKVVSTKLSTEIISNKLSYAKVKTCKVFALRILLQSEYHYCLYLYSFLFQCKEITVSLRDNSYLTFKISESCTYGSQFLSFTCYILQTKMVIFYNAFIKFTSVKKKKSPRSCSWSDSKTFWSFISHG